MAIVAGFDVHRAQITFDALDTETGEVMRGRIDATPAAVTRWTERFQGGGDERCPSRAAVSALERLAGHNAKPAAADDSRS